MTFNKTKKACTKLQTKQFFSGTIWEKLFNLVEKNKLDTEIWFKLEALLNKISAEESLEKGLVSESQ